MSKSDKNTKACIYLTDSPEMIRVKINKAATDSLGRINFDPEGRPELANLLRVWASLKGIDVRLADEYFQEDNMFSFK